MEWFSFKMRSRLQALDPIHDVQNTNQLGIVPE